MKLLKMLGYTEIVQGATLPRFYGFAWKNWATDTVACLPIPLNLVAAVGRSTWLFLRWGWQAVPADPRGAYHQGYKAGIRATQHDQKWP